MTTEAGKYQSCPEGNLAAAIYAELCDTSSPERKRKHARRHVRVALDVEIDGQVVRAHTQNVGPNSMSVICKTEAEPRTSIRVRRALPAGDWNDGRVRHCTGTVGAHKIGIEFATDSPIEQDDSPN